MKLKSTPPIPFLSDGGIKAFIQNNMLYTDGGYICRPCNKFIKAHLHRHVRDVHFSSNLKYQCPLCNKMTPSKNALQIHLRRHHPSEQFRGLDFDQCVLYDSWFVIYTDARVWCLVLFLFFQMVVSKPSSRTICCTLKVVTFASLATNLLRLTCLGMWETSTSAVISSTNVRFATQCLHQKMPFKFILEDIMALNCLEAWTLSNVSYTLSSFH